MYIESAGRGPDVVILHGLPQDPAELAELAAELRAVFTVHVVHLPGYGESAAPEGPYDFVAVERELIADLRARGVERAAVVGMSGGCYRAFHLALRSDLPVWGIVGIGPLGHVHAQNHAALHQYADAFEAGVDMRLQAVGRMFSAAWAAGNPARAMEIVDANLAAAPLPLVAGELRAICAMPDLRDEMGTLDIPVTLRVGALDVATPPFLSEELVGLLPQGRLDVVPGAGHMLHMEDGPATASAVRVALMQALPRSERLALAAAQLALDTLPSDHAEIRDRVCVVACDVVGGDYGTVFGLEKVQDGAFTSWGAAVGDAEVAAVWRPDERRTLPHGLPVWDPAAPLPSHEMQFLSLEETAHDVAIGPLIATLQTFYMPARIVDQARALLYSPEGRFVAFLGVLSRRRLAQEKLDDAQSLVEAFRDALLRADQLAGVPAHPEGVPYFRRA